MATSVRPSTRRDTALFGICVALALIARALPDARRDPLAASLRQTVIAPLVQLQRNAELSRRAWLTREQQTLQRDSVVLKAMELPVVRQENERLRQTLGLARRLQWGFVPADVLPGQGGTEEFTVTLSAGSKAGVQPYSPVVAPEGLVGMVKTVDPAMSIAILSTHPDFRVSAMAADGSAFGIVAAHLGAQPQRNLLELRGVPFRSTLKPGTLIWSSGLGGVYPRGIPIGWVLSEIQNPAEAWARTYLLRPAAAPADVETVMILKARRGDTDLSSAWHNAAAADSALRAVVAAGDSIIKADSTLARIRIDSILRADSARRAPATVPLPATPGAPAAPAPGTPAAGATDTTRARIDSIARRDSIARVRRARARRDSIARVRADSAARANPATPPDTARRPPSR